MYKEVRDKWDYTFISPDVSCLLLSFFISPVNYNLVFPETVWGLGGRTSFSGERFCTLLDNSKRSRSFKKEENGTTLVKRFSP